MRDTPGPGQYTPADCVSGNYVVSTFKNGGCIRMIRDLKPGRTRHRVSDTPGPGQYPPHSEFGNYKEYLARSTTKKTRNNRGMSDTNYSSLSPQKFGSDISLETPMTVPARPVSQLHQMNGTMRAQRLMKLVPSQEFSENTNSNKMHKRVNTMNGFYKTNGRLRNVKLINVT